MASMRPTAAAIGAQLKKLRAKRLTPLDLLPRHDPAEKLIELGLQGPPPGLDQGVAADLRELAEMLGRVATDRVRVMVLGGGTGLSNILGGDSRSPGWEQNPFIGLKEVFPKTSAVVCVTDDGGSTGELLKDLPLIGLGDLRHVLLSAIRRQGLRKRYQLNQEDGLRTMATLHGLFNLRFAEPPLSAATLLKEKGISLDSLPGPLRNFFIRLLDTLFADRCLTPLLARPHCLGNLLLAAAIRLQSGPGGAQPDRDAIKVVPHHAVLKGLNQFARMLGIGVNNVLPCTTSQARLQVLYSNGVLVTGEYKSGHARRGFPVDRVFVEFTGEPRVPAEVMAGLDKADIIVLAPGSLYTSTIPILQVPGVAAAIRSNRRALKILVANLWVQKGETDLVREDPGRRFHVSDLIKAYHRNVPGGVGELFHQVLTLGFRDIPGSILQNYAMEGKVPIYLDRDQVRGLGFVPVEAGIFSQAALDERRIIHHDPDGLAKAIQTLWAVRRHLPEEKQDIPGTGLPPSRKPDSFLVAAERMSSSERFRALERRLGRLTMTADQPLAVTGLRNRLLEILWKHWDLRIDHLDTVRGIHLVDTAAWSRCQQWDNVFSFYDPVDGLIKIRHDVLSRPGRFEVALLVALGQSLLGDYAAEKQMENLERAGQVMGKIFHLTIRPAGEYRSFLNARELDTYLTLARMVRSPGNEYHYTRLINGSEGFTPPGLLFGMTFAWYLDNRFAAYLEYKMAIMRNEISNLIPEQVKVYARRQALVDFFRRTVFRHW
ncbi:MAG: YvcK family protein [Desulfobacterales bacterium]|nr:YvcK family protein [Desulfobacterales bacterium]